MSPRLLAAVGIALFGVASSSAIARETAPLCSAAFPFGYDDPERQGVNTQGLLEMTRWIRSSSAPILSLLISRNGKIVYQLYSSQVDRNAAHYLMSVTKSVASALVGIAVDRHFIKSTDQSISESLPQSAFPNHETLKRFQGVTLKDVLGMSALDAKIFPTVNTPEAISRSRSFFNSPNRLAFALNQDVLPKPGDMFQYTDITPIIASGVVQYATKRSLFDFGKSVLFDPLGFENAEWMHQDKFGIDNTSFGLRLRPIDMQKFGVLFLNRGCWEGQQLISKEWVATSFSPWIKSASTLSFPNYGWYWWLDRFAAPGWTGHTARGWKGQRITIFPEKNLVVSMTAIVEDNNEQNVYEYLFNRFIIPTVNSNAFAGDSIAELKAQLKSALDDVWANKNAVSSDTEARMIPSATAREKHIDFHN